jgi:GNAT superfamily N-acetyltransferase
MALCHIACFPESLSSKLGIRYVKKTLEWFLHNPNRFLYHVEVQNTIAGYCGGFVPQFYGDGSSSGMLQHAFNEALIGLATRPWLLFHSEVRQQYRFLWLNIRRKFTGKSIPLDNTLAKPAKPTHVGLVVIGVHPDFRGSGAAQLLADEFEKKAKAFNKHELILSVKTDNKRAINAYKKFGWNILSEQKNTYVMNKMI